MPIISQFYGIKISLFYSEHGEPHIHAYYGEFNAKITLKGQRLVAGRLPRRATNLVTIWMQKHQRELEENWARSLKHQILNYIEPLR